eukprot:7794592-Ditylum_brightwellii.AAC.1
MSVGVVLEEARPNRPSAATNNPIFNGMDDDTLPVLPPLPLLDTNFGTINICTNANNQPTTLTKYENSALSYPIRSINVISHVDVKTKNAKLHSSCRDNNVIMVVPHVSNSVRRSFRDVFMLFVFVGGLEVEDGSDADVASEIPTPTFKIVHTSPAINGAIVPILTSLPPSAAPAATPKPMALRTRAIFFPVEELEEDVVFSFKSLAAACVIPPKTL